MLSDFGRSVRMPVRFKAVTQRAYSLSTGNNCSIEELLQCALMRLEIVLSYPMIPFLGEIGLPVVNEKKTTLRGCARARSTGLVSTFFSF